MFESRVTATTIILGVMVAMVYFILGCDSSDRNNDVVINSSSNNQYVYEYDEGTISTSINLNNALVQLYNPMYDSINSEIVMPYQVSIDNENYDNRLLILSSSIDEIATFKAQIYDDNNNSLLACIVETSPTDTNSFCYYEITDTDTLIIQRTIDNEYIFEKYNLNSRIYDIQFTLQELEDFKLIVNTRYELNQALNEFPDSLKNKYSKFILFANFYERDISINNNFDGEILTELLTDTDFQTWFLVAKADLDICGDPRLDISAEKVCGIAGVTSFFKCTFGGAIANFVCVAAVGTSLACGVAAIAS